MLTSNTRLKLQGILRRIAHQEEVGLSDRIYVQKFADHDATVASWLRTARRLQRALPPLGWINCSPRSTWVMSMATAKPQESR